MILVHSGMAQQETKALPEGLQVEELADGVRVGGWRIETAARRGILKSHDMERYDAPCATVAAYPPQRSAVGNLASGERSEECAGGCGFARGLHGQAAHTKRASSDDRTDGGRVSYAGGRTNVATGPHGCV